MRELLRKWPFSLRRTVLLFLIGMCLGSITNNTDKIAHSSGLGYEAAVESVRLQFEDDWMVSDWCLESLLEYTKEETRSLISRDMPTHLIFRERSHQAASSYMEKKCPSPPFIYATIEARGTAREILKSG